MCSGSHKTHPEEYVSRDIPDSEDTKWCLFLEDISGVAFPDEVFQSILTPKKLLKPLSI